jgi:hypothetical protein
MIQRDFSTDVPGCTNSLLGPFREALPLSHVVSGAVMLCSGVYGKIDAPFRAHRLLQAGKYKDNAERKELEEACWKCSYCMEILVTPTNMYVCSGCEEVYCNLCRCQCTCVICNVKEDGEDPGRMFTYWFNAKTFFECCGGLASVCHPSCNSHHADLCQHHHQNNEEDFADVHMTG